MAARIVVIDNYDSFVYNLVQYLGTMGADLTIHRNDQIDLQGLLGQRPDGLLISPGPGTPSSAGISEQAISAMAEICPVLGVCLGHQAIGEVYGARVIRGRVMHGKTSAVDHDGRGVFEGLSSPLTATRYHSLVIDPTSVPDQLEVTATTADGVIMGVRHRALPVEGVQFHPESVLTEAGWNVMANWLSTCGQLDPHSSIPGQASLPSPG